MYKKVHIILGFLSFIIPFILYVYTMAPTTSFWDCGEFIATSYILGVPHPPGSPLFLLLGNVFSNIPFFDDVGARVNLISPIASALSVMFLYFIIVKLIEEFNGRTNSSSNLIINNLSAFLAALTFAITDSHWFNAVETEVYSLSTFFTAISVWMILKWSSLSKDNWNIRYLLLIAYMIGLAIGIHILNLLTLPFIGLIIYFKKYKNVSTYNIFIVLVLTVVAFIIIYYGIILGLPDIVSKFNSLLIIIFGIGIVFLSIIFLHLRSSVNFYLQITKILSILSVMFIVFISYNKLFIKSTDAISSQLSNDITVIDDAFYYYLNEQEKQSGNYDNIDYEYLEDLKKDRALILKNQKVFEKKKNKMSFLGLIFWQSKAVILGFILLLIGIPYLLYFYFFNKKDDNLYLSLKVVLLCFLLIFIGYSSYATIFIRANQEPRINENNPNTLDRAVSYINREQYGAIQSFNPKSAIQSSTSGHWKRWTKDKNNPTILEQISYVWNYQIKEMYLRYFAWQFIGRSDKQSDKAWLIKDLDGNLIGNRSLDGIDFFRYGVPLVFFFGLIGIYAHFMNDWKRALAVLSVFLATGLMLVLYLNQYDPQPRERDYSYVGSFFAFAIWVGIGISFLQQKIKEFFEDLNVSSFISTTIVCLIFMLMTFTMSAKDYKEHSRRGNYVAWDYGYNLLNSCEPNAIIFTNGDNDTFPLWYLQEVEKIRRDVRVVNLSLLNTPWYIEQLMNDSPKLNIKFNHPNLIEDIYNIESDYLISTEEGYSLCSKEFKGQIPWSTLDCDLNINKTTKLQFKVPAYRQQVLRIQDYMILQLINDLFTTRPIYFAATVSESNQLGLGRYLQMEGMTYRLVSEKLPDNIIESINYDKMKLNLTQSTLSDTIKNIDDYKKEIDEKIGIYRYRNLNNDKIFFSDNIKRLVQNYRIGYLRLMQHQLNENNFDEVSILSKQLNEYFPISVLPMDPWLGFELIDKIYIPLQDLDNIELMISHMIDFNADINVKLLSILKFHEIFKSGIKTDNLVLKNLIEKNVLLKHKLALLDELSRRIENIEELPESFIIHLIDNSQEFSFNEKLILYQSISQIGSKFEINSLSQHYSELIKNLLINHYNTDLSDVDYQKYLSDNLILLIGPQDFFEFAYPYVVNNQKIEGMLYTFINILIDDIQNGSSLMNKYKKNESLNNLGISTLDSWIDKYPNNQRLINKRNKFESIIISN